MFERMSHGWTLAKQSLTVLKLDKELLLFPLLSGIACVLVIGSFAVPLWNHPDAQAIFNENQQMPQSPVAYVLLFAFYFANYFVIVFFNSALVSCAVIRFTGGDPTLGDGLRAATSRLPQIVAWSLVSATVGMILRIVESRSERAGAIVAAILGTAWSIMTFFVVPVLVVEKLGPIAAFKRSLAVLRQTWGEAIGANFGIGFITFLFMLPTILMIFGGVMLIGAGNAALGGILTGVGVLLMILTSLVSSALDAIILAALYLHATGHPPQGFDDEMLDDAFVR